jgi:hypothetical protein
MIVRQRLSTLAVLPLFACCILLHSQSTPEKADDAVFTPPPMGWSSWNSFSNLINSDIVQTQAQALIHSGLAKSGYSYVNIDEGWWQGARDADGAIVVETARWPAIVPGEKAGDMSNIVRYLHGLGLKAGIYTDVGEAGCSFYGPDLGPPMPHTGSEGHYAQDFMQFARWGFEYVKVDWCGGSKENLDPAVQYAEIAHAIREAEAATGRTLFYSICNWGGHSPWTWAPGVGGIPADIWRTGGDIVAPVVAGTANSSRKATFAEMLRNFDNNLHPEAQHTGFYNDADMMVVGMPGLSEAQNRVHVSLWAISSAPMILGADLTTLTPATVSMLTNPDVLAIDQDRLGLQPVRVSGPGATVEVWAKILADSDAGKARRAILLLNRTRSDAQTTLPIEHIGLLSKSVSVREIGQSGKLPEADETSVLHVAAGDARLLLAEGVNPPADHFVPATKANDGRLWVFSKIAAGSQFAWARITYANRGRELELVTLRVDGDRQSTVGFPPTGSSHPQAVTIIVKFPEGRKGHEISLSSDDAAPLSIESLELLAAKQ